VADLAMCGAHLLSWLIWVPIIGDSWLLGLRDIEPRLPTGFIGMSGWALL